MLAGLGDHGVAASIDRGVAMSSSPSPSDDASGSETPPPVYHLPPPQAPHPPTAASHLPPPPASHLPPPPASHLPPPPASARSGANTWPYVPMIAVGLSAMSLVVALTGSFLSVGLGWSQDQLGIFEASPLWFLGLPLGWPLAAALVASGVLLWFVVTKLEGVKNATWALACAVLGGVVLMYTGAEYEWVTSEIDRRAEEGLLFGTLGVNVTPGLGFYAASAAGVALLVAALFNWLDLANSKPPPP
jgi:hypothetical protein